MKLSRNAPSTFVFTCTKFCVFAPSRRHQKVRQRRTPKEKRDALHRHTFDRAPCRFSTSAGKFRNQSSGRHRNRIKNNDNAYNTGTICIAIVVGSVLCLYEIGRIFDKFGTICTYVPDQSNRGGKKRLEKKAQHRKLDFKVFR